MCEAQLHDSNSFITLTYRDERFSLDYTDFQLFMKRLRARFPRAVIRFYMCGEYGELNSRPHFHACLFGFQFPDLVYLRSTDTGSKLYRSPILEELWPFGFSSVGDVTFESAAYVARYVMKKVSGSETHHEIIDPDTGESFRRVKEFARMSLGGRQRRGGIGKPWLMKFMSDVYPHGKIVVNGHECKPPRYFDKLFRLTDAGGAMELAVRRAASQEKYFGEILPARLEARAAVSKAKASLLKRKIL